MNRRTLLQSGLSTLLLGGTWSQRASLADDVLPTPHLGLVTYCCQHRRRWLQRQRPAIDLFEPLTFLKHARELGAGGIQISLGVLSAERVAQIRAYAEQNGLFVEAMVSPPANDSDLERFAAEMKTAAAAGASAARTVIMPGRRYEQFQSLAEFKEFEQRGKQQLQRAIPIIEQTGVALAVENHKDQRIDERVALFKELDHELIGACVDTGNSLALLEEPLETVRALAPYTRSVHLKDQAVQGYEQGFLLGDIPLGQGCLDLPAMVDVLQGAKPEIQFSLELITRDPLQVPCLEDKYWRTLESVPAADLARVIRLVKAQSAETLPHVSELSLEAQVALEDENVKSSLSYARLRLGL